MVASFPYAYTFDFSRGMGDWSTWLRPSVLDIDPGSSDPGFVRLQAPGTLDPNHIDGLGSLSLIAHLSTAGNAFPGFLDLREAEIELVVRGHNFDAKGAKIVFWVCSTLPDGQTSQGFPVGMQITNWANTGGDIADAITDGWQTITVSLDTDAADWTEAGNYRSIQGDWGGRYQPLDLETALSRVDATLHLVALSDTPNDRPTGFLDLASITIRTSQPAIANGRPAPGAVAWADEDGVAYGTLAGSGSDGETTFAIIEGSMQHGQVVLDAVTGDFVFTPDPDFFGPDTANGSAGFRYVRITAEGASDPIDALVYVTPRNDAPVTAAPSENMTIGRDAPFAFTLLHGADVDNDRLGFQIVDGSVAHGAVVLDATTGRYVFTPDTDHVGAAGFSYVVTDGQAVSAPKSVSFDVVEDAPALPGFIDMVSVNLPGDIDAFVRDTIRLALAGDINAGYHYGRWLASGVYVTQDITSAATFLRQGLAATSDAALLLAQLYIAGEGVARDYAEARTLLAGVDGNADAVFRMAMLQSLGLGGAQDTVAAAEGFREAAGMGHAEAMATLGRRYLSGEGVAASMEDAYFWLKAALARTDVPLNEGFAAIVSFDTNEAAATISPTRLAELDGAALSWAPGRGTPVNDAPVAGPDAEVSRGTMSEAITGVLARGSDIDGDRMSYVLVDVDAGVGTVTIDPATGTFTYVPAPGFFGTGHFTYALSDGQTLSAPKAVALDVQRATIAFADTATVVEGSRIERDASGGVIANDLPRDGSGMTVIAVGGSPAGVGTALETAYGVLVLAADGSFRFHANRAETLTQDQVAIDTIAYEVETAGGERATAFLSIRIEGAGGTVLSGDGVLIGTGWNDRIIGGDGADYLISGDGDDVLDGGAGGFDALQGGRGDDTYLIRHIGDTPIEFAGEGIDTVETELAVFVLHDAIENLTGTSVAGQQLTGNALANIIQGGSNNDVLDGGGGDDILDGGTGTDVVHYAGAAAGVFVQLTHGTATDRDGGIDTLRGIEDVDGSAFDDTVIGDTGANRIQGGAGSDYLIGVDGNDVLDGGDGLPNAVQGGAGDDTYVVRVLGDTLIEFADEGTDTVVTALERYTLRDHLEHLTGTATAGQVLTGNALANVIIGSVGDDVLDGRESADTLVGGAGHDRFVLTLSGLYDVDTIVDFTLGEDRIVLAADLFGGRADEVPDAATFVLGGHAQDADDRFLYDPASGRLLYDCDGTGYAEAIAIGHLSQALALSAADFIFG